MDNLQKLKFKKKQKKLTFVKNKIAKSYFDLSLEGKSSYGLKANTCFRFPKKQIILLKKFLNFLLKKKKGKVVYNLFANIPVTKKPKEIRMGKGKGDFSFWVLPVKKGQIIFEIYGVSKFEAKIIFLRLKKKLQVLTTVIV